MPSARKKRPPVRAKSAAKPAARKSTATKSSSKASASRSAAKPALQDVVLAALDDMKAANVKVLDVANLTAITDTMVIACGTSDRHVRSIANEVVMKVKAAGHRPFGVEGDRDGEWVLVDLPGVLVHIMLPRVREFYGLEKLWEV